jgi:phospholipid/cholesterol/gamma-HCH transport system ATP-binding protein
VPTVAVTQPMIHAPVRASEGGSTTVVAAPPIWEVRGISKAFGDKVLFRDASLVLHRRETLAIIGESGCGKSVFLKMMIGLVEPDAGHVFYKGKDVAEMTGEELDKMRTNVGYLFQAGALFDSMTVHDNVAYALHEHTKQGDEEIRERVKTCLEMVNLRPTVIDDFPATLSGGMRKRVALARAIALEPEVVLYDEPTQGLDPQSITAIADMITELADRLQITSVLVTHDMRCAFGVCDRIAMMHDHRFEFVGTPKWFLQSEEPVVREFIDEAREDLEDVGIAQAVLAT